MMMPAPALVLVGFLGGLSAAVGCGPPADSLDEAQRLERIDEMFDTFQRDFSEVPNITVTELAALQEDGNVTLIDVRPAEERSVSMIPGSISSDAFEAALQANPEAYADGKVVTYCTIGYRSGVYAEKLREQGLDALNLRGSILAWTHAGKPLVDAQGATNKLHVYGKPWDLAADGYTTVW